MNPVQFELAAAADDAALRALFAANEMEGEIAVSFHREPSYFYASGVQGDFCQVLAGRDTVTGELAAVGARATRPGYLNGQLAEVGYLADARIDPRYRGLGVVLEGARALARLHADGRARLYFTVIAEGNRQALGTITRGRWGLPTYMDMGRLLSPAVNLVRRLRPPVGNWEITRGAAALLPEIVACLNRNHQRRQFAPAYPLSHFQPGSPRLRDFDYRDFYVALRDGRVVGVVGKWDQERFKQTVVTRYGPRLRRLRPLLNLAAPLIGCPRFPEPGQPLRSFYAALIAVDEDDPDVFRALLRHLNNDHLGSGYAYFLVGLHERDPLAAILKEFTLTPFTARLFAVHFPDGKEAFAALDNRVPYVELAAL